VKLSIVICAYNEQRSILSVLDRTLQVELPEGWEREIILVDNASTDGTQDLLRAVKGPGIKAIFHPRNLGKGASIRTGFSHATGDYVVIQDADTEYDPADLARLLQRAIELDADAVFGSRILGGQRSYHYASAYWGVRALTLTTNLLCGGELTDVAVATKMVRTSVLPGLGLRGEHFDLDFELPVKLLRAGYRIHEVPVAYRPRTYEEGKKIKPLDGLRAFWVILRERFRPAPPIRTA
jgi:glycosyltransferase involved in cell wall biosynthesis